MLDALFKWTFCEQCANVLVPINVNHAAVDSSTSCQFSCLKLLFSCKASLDRIPGVGLELDF